MRTRAKSRRPRAFNSKFRHFSPGGKSPSSTRRVYRIQRGLTSLLRVGLAELSVSDAKQLGKRRRSFGREIFVGAKMSFDDLGRGFCRIVDHGFRFFGFGIATTQNSLHRNVEPRGESRDVVCVRFAGAVFDAREGRGGDGCFTRDVAQAEPELFAPALDGAPELFGVNETFSWTILGFHGT